MASEPIPYATSPVTGYAKRGLLPAAILCATGLGLAVIGGSLLIGVLTVTKAEPSPFLPNAELLRRAAQEDRLVSVLYATSAANFLGATLLIVLGVRRL